jgi:hypothetical protein
MLKSDAEDAVKRIRGVSRVINDIEVLPLSPMDNQIRARILSGHLRRSCPVGPLWFSGGAFYSHPGEERERGGGGPRRQRHGQNIAGLRSDGAPGVFSVTNDLVAESELAR